MIKKMLYKRILVATFLLIVINLFHFIPSNDKKTVSQSKEYTYSNDISSIYLLDEFNNMTRVSLSINNCNKENMVRDIVEGLIIDGVKSDKIPDGFTGVIPKGTRILNIEIIDDLAKINLSKDVYNIKINQEEKMIEGLVYSITSISGINKIQISIDGKILERLPNSKKILPKYLDKNYGINKIYELASTRDIDTYTLYYVLNYNDYTYYTPVTKYVNNNKLDKIKIIIEELSSSIATESNLLSYLNSNIELIDYQLDDNLIRLEFNDLILSDINDDNILEEVIYTIGLSIMNELDVDKVCFMLKNEEIATFSQKGIEK